MWCVPQPFHLFLFTSPVGHGFDESYESDEETRQEHVENWHCSGRSRRDWSQEVRLLQNVGCPCRGGSLASQEDRETHRSWHCDDQDPREACDKGGQEGNVRKSRGGQGATCEDRREGLPCRSHQEGNLSRFGWCGFGPLWVARRAD